MPKPSTNEKAFNFAFCSVLRKKHPHWRKNLNAEQTRVIDDHPGMTPDIVLSQYASSPVVVETEFLPASNVESDAKSRLRRVLVENNRPIEHAIALRIPRELKFVEQNQLEDLLEESQFSYCSYSIVNGDEIQRWPKTAWMEGNADDVANFLESVSLTESLVNQSTEILEKGVAQAANIIATTPLEIQVKIGKHLYQSEGEQTNRMAGAIIANAMIFHSRSEGFQGIPTLSSIKNLSGMPKSEIIDSWNWIYSTVNYWPIFKIASDLLDEIPMQAATEVLSRLYKMSNTLTQIGATGLNDLCGRMFQKLIADRKFLATFYTLPVSATFLSELVISRLNINWKDPNEVVSLRVADFACGTGTLIGALYQAILSRFRRAGNDDKNIHSRMLERSIYAFDIMPAATHLTASTLSNAHPDITFGTTKIVTMPYGRDNTRATYIGSLELLEDTKVRSLLSLGRQQLTGDNNEVQGKLSDKPLTLTMDTDVDHDVDMRHESLDIVIMNPPFSRPTKHTKATADVPIPSFAGFNTDQQEQAEMSARLKKLRRTLDEPAGHGNAGLASNFIDLAHVKLKPGGILGLILPATFAAGGSWESARNLLQNNYSDITIVSITSIGKTEAAFSADTSIAEVLVIATKKKVKVNDNLTKIGSDTEDSQYQFINLAKRPSNHAEALELAKFVKLNRGNQGTGRVSIGSQDSYGVFFTDHRYSSSYVGLSESNLAGFMQSIARGEFISTQTKLTHNIPVTQLGELGTRGLLHRDLTGGSEAAPRGPFDRVELRENTVPTYPGLWSHDHQRERKFFVAPDCEYIVRRGQESAAAQMWREFTSKLHIALDLGLNSLSLVACLTKDKNLGGRAWPNFILSEDHHEKAIALWFNSSLGIMSHWWEGAKQQIGRSIITVSRLQNLLTLDTRKLDAATLDDLDQLFDQFHDVEFLPVSQCHQDSNRIALDEELFAGVLGVSPNIMDDFNTVRRQWCAEPRVHGRKD